MAWAHLGLHALYLGLIAPDRMVLVVAWKKPGLAIDVRAKVSLHAATLLGRIRGASVYAPLRWLRANAVYRHSGRRHNRHRD